jgi:transposase
MLHNRSVWEVPEGTAREVRSAMGKNNVYVRLRDELGPLYQDSEFAHLFVWRGRPAESPGLLAMVTIMQFAEGLTDRQAADAVRSRMDWKYALGLELGDPGFAHSVLSEFRQRLLDGGAEMHLLDGMLSNLQEQGWVKARGKQRTDSTHVFAVIRQLNRLECVGETMRNALNDLATVAPEWLMEQVPHEWYERYGSRFEAYRLPKKKGERLALQQEIGEDGVHLLQYTYRPDAPGWLWELPSVQILRLVWVQQYYLEEEQLYVRTKKEQGLPPNKRLIQSPYDPEARNRTKRSTNWTGYMVHLTETCDEDRPHIITQVTTTPATTGDVEMTGEIHAALAAKDLPPREHFVDTSYVDTDHLVDSSEQGIDLVGPAPADSSWQAAAEAGFDIAAFAVDWDKQQVICPVGIVSDRWSHGKDSRDSQCIYVSFPRRTCLSCSQRQQCTRSKGAPRQLKLKAQEQHTALQQARKRQQTAAFKQRYKRRAGVEGTISQGVRAFSLRRSRYVGLAKTHFQDIATAAAINLTRMAAWLANEPMAKTRHSRFAMLAVTN